MTSPQKGSEGVLKLRFGGFSWHEKKIHMDLKYAKFLRINNVLEMKIIIILIFIIFSQRKMHENSFLSIIQYNECIDWFWLF